MMTEGHGAMGTPDPAGAQPPVCWRRSAAVRPAKCEVAQGANTILANTLAEALTWTGGMSRHEFVANAPHRTQVSRFGGILFHFLAQPRHMDRYGTCIAKVF